MKSDGWPMPLTTWLLLRRKITESELQSLGYEVTSVADTGEKAIEKAEADKPDLMLMDMVW
ncbi:MAG: hypothetical protein HQ517_11630 [SAR324 cluster bacterium]|nr:hypothetical protein [SAR324 cluster bacterium]